MSIRCAGQVIGYTDYALSLCWTLPAQCEIAEVFWESHRVVSHHRPHQIGLTLWTEARDVQGAWLKSGACCIHRRCHHHRCEFARRSQRVTSTNTLLATEARTGTSAGRTPSRSDQRESGDSSEECARTLPQ